MSHGISQPDFIVHGILSISGITFHVSFDKHCIIVNGTYKKKNKGFSCDYGFMKSLYLRELLSSKMSTEHYFDLWFIYVYFSNDSVVIQVMFNRCTARSIYLSFGCMGIILKTLILLMVKEANTDSMKVFMYHHYFHICKQ